MSKTEKRRVRRREILERFSFHVCVPKLGFARHQVRDISELGIGFEIETFGEFRLDAGEICELRFYLNPSLFLTLSIEVVRQKDHGAIQEVGAVFAEQQSGQYSAFVTLVKLVDQLAISGAAEDH